MEVGRHRGVIANEHIRIDSNLLRKVKIFQHLGLLLTNIRMDLEEIGINAGNCVDSAQARDYWRAFVNAALNLRVP